MSTKKNVATTKKNVKTNEVKTNEVKTNEVKTNEVKTNEVKTNEVDNLDEVITNIDNEVKKLSLIVLSEIKALLPQKKLDVNKINEDYKKTIAKAKETLIASEDDNASDIYTETVTKAKLDRDNALNSGSLWQAIASEYEIDKDFLVKCGFKELSDKENSNKFNCLITSLFNIVKYAHSTKNKLEDCKKAYESIGSDKLCKVFKHGCYGAKKTFNSVKGKEGLNSKIEMIDTLYNILTK